MRYDKVRYNHIFSVWHRQCAANDRPILSWGSAMGRRQGEARERALARILQRLLDRMGVKAYIPWEVSA